MRRSLAHLSTSRPSSTLSGIKTLPAEDAHTSDRSGSHLHSSCSYLTRRIDSSGSVNIVWSAADITQFSMAPGFGTDRDYRLYASV
jgi:hypothetical protein